MTAVFLSLLVFSSAADAQCNWTPRFSGQFRTTAFDVAVDNDFLWLATGYGVQLLQRNGASVRSLDAVPLPGQTRVVRANASGLAYVGSGTRLYVLRRNGTRIEVVRFTEAGGTINDIAIHQNTDLFVATSAGGAHFQLVPADTPIRTNAIFATSSQNVSAMAIAGSNLYTADGDSSVEIFNISIPSLAQKTDQLDTVPAATAVFTSDNFVYVSDRFGQSTDVFSGKTRLVRLPYGTTSFAPSSARAHFIAGPNRTLRAVDFTNLTQAAEIFEDQLPPTDGTENVIHAMARASDTIYIAAGDIGLVTLDARPLAKPYPMAGYTTGATTSSIAAGDRAWLSDATGTIFEEKIDIQGISLSQQRTWSAGSGALVQDVNGTSLLTVANATATVWSLTPTTPSVSRTVTFPAAIAQAVIQDSGTIVALLGDGRVFTANATTPSVVSVPAMASMARSGSAIALMQVNNDGTTTVRHYTTGDLSSAAKTIALTGAAIGNLALDTTRAAVFLFNGVNVIDLAAGTATPIAGSNGLFPTHLSFAGDDLLLLADRTLFVYDNARTFSHQVQLPANSTAMDATSQFAAIANAAGMSAVLHQRVLPEAQLLTSNAFPTKLLAGGNHVYAFSRDGLEIYSAVTGYAPHYTGAIPAANLVDAAASESRVYTLSGTAGVTAYSSAGAEIGQTSINDGPDTQPLAITVAGNAVWVSIAKGCSTGACERKTFVLDPATLAVTDNFTGRVVDTAVSGTKAYVLTTLPEEIRALNITDPLHPAATASIAAPTTARSLAFANGTVYVLGDRVYAYSETSLAQTGTFLTASTPSSSHQIRIAGSCVLISGRSSNPELYTLPGFTAASTFDVPSPVRSISATTTRVVLLTDHSTEVWTSSPSTPAKRRASD